MEGGSHNITFSKILCWRLVIRMPWNKGTAAETKINAG